MSLLLVFISGLIATLGMTVVLYLMRYFKIPNADLIGAIGSLFSRNEEKSVFFGLLTHFAIGGTIAYLYFGVWSMFGFSKLFPGVGLLTGFAQGLVISMMLIVLVKEHHPLEKYRKTGFSIAMAHFVANIVYGGILEYEARFLEENYAAMSVVKAVLSNGEKLF